MNNQEFCAVASTDSPRAVISQSLLKAEEYCTAGEYGAAMQVLGGVLVADPEHAEAWHRTGVVAGILGDMGGARACMERSLELDASNSDYLNNLAFLYQNMEMRAEARVLYGRALMRDGENVSALRNLVGMLDVDQDREMIKACMSQLTKLQPQDEDVAGLCKAVCGDALVQNIARAQFNTQLENLVQNEGTIQ